MGVEHLHKARGVKNDEFYTQLSDIELELAHYKQHLKGKHIYCNCDNPKFSKFWEYFHVHFNELGLKQLTVTYYDKTAFVNRYDYYGENDNDITSAVVAPLNSHGDFRSPQCMAIMKAADIVVTNPPFSLMQQFIIYLNKYNKDFIIIAPQILIGFKQVFPLIKTKQLFCGVNAHETAHRNIMQFVNTNGQIVDQVAGWYTTILPDIEKPIYQFTADYDITKYPMYDNYDAIEVTKVTDIPDNYYGMMGVPISFLRQLNYNQFDVIGITQRGAADMSLRSKIYKPSDYPNWNDLNVSAVIIKNGQPKITYSRLLIKRKR